MSKRIVCAFCGSKELVRHEDVLGCKKCHFIMPVFYTSWETFRNGILVTFTAIIIFLCLIPFFR